MEETTTEKVNHENWSALGLTEGTLELLEKESFLEPTPVQQKAIPVALEGQDLLVSAKTGSGKTAGFCFPMIERIRGRKGTLGLIMCPTREIAIQTQEVLLKFAKPQGITSVSIIGGVGIRPEEKALKEYPQIIVATPGKICDHYGRGNVWLEYVEVVVLDEADRMLDMGFAKELNTIMDALPQNRQTLFFSATINRETEKLANNYLYQPKRISLGSALKVADTIEQELLWVNERAKIRELKRILDEEDGIVIIFTRTKVKTLEVFKEIYYDGFKDADYLSSDKAQSDREKTLNGFREGETRILVATDVAGRGIHVEDVAHVINFDFPGEPEDYIHRVGRTGRNKKSGRATTFVTSQDSRSLIQVEKILKTTIPEKRAHDYRMERPRKKRSRFRR